MYSTLLIAHSVLRWAVLISLVNAIYFSWQGYQQKRIFAKKDDLIRHGTATLTHIQLTLGIILYTQSPVVKFYFSQYPDKAGEPVFFGMIHIIMMLIAVVVITIGSAKSKRKSSDLQKFKTMLLYYSIALIIIFIAIPWPFSPLASRPLIRY